jgi:hypothetical protein
MHSFGLKIVSGQKAVFISLTALVMFVLCLSPAHAVFINEIHYDNSGADTGEGVELAGAAGQDLAGWSLLFYNGNSGSVYKDYALAGVFIDAQQGMGVLDFSISGIQNGSPDGIALVDDAGSVLQFLSYEGNVTANDGAATGLTSIDIGVAENGSTPEGSSLQLLGSGREYSDFYWAAGIGSFAGINMRQTFAVASGQLQTSVPEPASGILLLLGLLLLAILRSPIHCPGHALA